MAVSLLDKFIVVFALMLVVLAFSSWRGDSGIAMTFEIRNGSDATAFPLAQDQVISISGALGESEIEVRDGQVRFLRSPCTNQFCTLAGWLKKAGDMAVCLPNGVSLRLVGGRQYDSINF